MKAALLGVVKILVWIAATATAAACFAMTGLCAGAQQYVTAGLFGLVGVVVVVSMAFLYESKP